MSEARDGYYKCLECCGYVTPEAREYITELEQQNKELRELLNYAMVILMNHEQSYDEDWIKDYQSCCQIYEQIIT